MIEDLLGKQATKYPNVVSALNNERDFVRNASALERPGFLGRGGERWKQLQNVVNDALKQYGDRPETVIGAIASQMPWLLDSPRQTREPKRNVVSANHVSGHHAQEMALGSGYEIYADGGGVHFLADGLPEEMVFKVEEMPSLKHIFEQAKQVNPKVPLAGVRKVLEQYSRHNLLNPTEQNLWYMVNAADQQTGPELGNKLLKGLASQLGVDLSQPGRGGQRLLGG